MSCNCIIKNISVLFCEALRIDFIFRSVSHLVFISRSFWLGKLPTPMPLAGIQLLCSMQIRNVAFYLIFIDCWMTGPAVREGQHWHGRGHGHLFRESTEPPPEMSIRVGFNVVLIEIKWTSSIYLRKFGCRARWATVGQRMTQARNLGK